LGSLAQRATPLSDSRHYELTPLIPLSSRIAGLPHFIRQATQRGGHARIFCNFDIVQNVTI